MAMGCKEAGASRIIGVDVNPDKFKLGMVVLLVNFCSIIHDPQILIIKNDFTSQEQYQFSLRPKFSL